MSFAKSHQSTKETKRIHRFQGKIRELFKDEVARGYLAPEAYPVLFTLEFAENASGIVTLDKKRAAMGEKLRTLASEGGIRLEDAVDDAKNPEHRLLKVKIYLANELKWEKSVKDRQTKVEEAVKEDFAVAGKQ